MTDVWKLSPNMVSEDKSSSGETYILSAVLLIQINHPLAMLLTVVLAVKMVCADESMCSVPTFPSPWLCDIMLQPTVPLPAPISSMYHCQIDFQK